MDIKQFKKLCKAHNEKIDRENQIFVDTFLKHAVNGNNHFIFTKERGIGKSTILKQLGLELQAMGYFVFIMSLSNHFEYMADKKLFNEEDMVNYPMKNTVILIDDITLHELKEIIENHEAIPVVGYVRIRECDSL